MYCRKEFYSFDFQPSAMNTIDQIPLARLRPDKFDDIAVKEQISAVNARVDCAFFPRRIFFSSTSVDSTRM